jgi:hypothetical protein
MAKKEEQSLPPLGDINLAFETELSQKQLTAQEEMAKSLEGDNVASDLTLKAHTPLLEDIKRGLDASSLTLGERFKRFSTNLGGLAPSRADIKSRHAAEKAEVDSAERSKNMLGLAKMQLRTNMNIEKALTGNRLADIEARRDAGDRHQSLVDAISGLKGDVEEEEPSFLKKIFQGLFVLGLAISGFLIGFKEALFDQLRVIKKFFSSLKIVTRLKALGTSIKLAFTNSKIGAAIMKLIDPIRRIFSKQGSIGKAIGFIKNAFGKVGKFFSTIKNFFSSFIKLSSKSSKIFSFFKSFGRIAGKLFLPLTIIMGAYEAIQGFMKGFKEGGIIGGIIGAVDGLIDFLVDAPINMIKDLVSWLLKKLGFDNAAASMDAFEFDLSGMISGVFTTMVNWVRGLFGLGPMGGEDEPSTPDEGGWSFMGMLSDVWNKLTSFFTDKFSWEAVLGVVAFMLEWSLPGIIYKVANGIFNFFADNFSWETIKEGLMTVIKWSPLGILTRVMIAIGEWFGNLFDIDFSALGKWVLSSMGSIGAAVGSVLGLGGGGDGETAEEDGAVKKEKFVDMLKSKVAEQTTQLAELQEESMIQGKIIKELQTLYDNTKDAAAEGGGVAINNAPVTSSTVNNSSESITMPLSTDNSDSTFQGLLRQESTLIGS